MEITSEQENAAKQGEAAKQEKARKRGQAARRVQAVVQASRARRRLAQEIAAYRTPAERAELDLILGRHTEEQIAEIDAILNAA